MKSLQISDLPSSPIASVSDKYMFIDTKQVVEDMRDLGYQVAGFRRPNTRTANGLYGLHEVDFRMPRDLATKAAEAPRVLFINSYDGSKRAQLISGIIRFACSNGLVVGSLIEKQKFLHLGDYAASLIAQIKESATTAQKVFERIADFKSIQLDHGQYLEYATKAAALRYPEGTLDITPEVILSPRRRDDIGNDLWTRFNVVQENLVKGGITGVNTLGHVRSVNQLTQIQQSNDLNQKLWDLTEEYAALV